MDVLFRRHGKWLEVGAYGAGGQMQPLPTQVRQGLIYALTYTYSFCERTGANAISAVQTEPRVLGMLTTHGTIMTGIGCLPRLSQQVIPRMNCRPWFQDLTPLLPRPNCYQTDWDAVRSRFAFRPRQEECLQAIANSENGVGGVIDACTGFGKTSIFQMLAVLYPYAKIAIAVAGAEIVPQIYRGLLRHTNGAGMVTGRYKRKGRVTVYTADSLHHCDNDIDIFLGDECLTGDSLVATPSGEKRLEDVVVGDVVVCYDETTGQLAQRLVTKTWARDKRVVMRITTAAGVIRCTANHPVMTARGWVQAGQLRLTDKLVSIAALHAEDRDDLAVAVPGKIFGETCQPVCPTSYVPLLRIERLADAEQVFDLEVEGCHNFFANGLLVHNCHELVTEGRVAKMSHLRHARTYFFSGSVDDRMDGLQARLEPLSGPTIFKLPYQEGVELGLVVPMRVVWLPVECNENPCAGATGVVRSRKGLWRNQIRNGAIARFLQQNVPQNEQVLISVNTLEHAVFLQQLLPDYVLAYAGADLRKVAKYKAWGMLPQEWQPLEAEERGRLRDAFSDGRIRKAIATTVWSRGVNFDGLSVLVRADGGASGVKNKQWPGRACRIASGKTGSIIVDCADRFDDALWRHTLKRKKDYESMGWEQEWPYQQRGRYAVPT